MLLQSTRSLNADTFRRFNRHSEAARRNRRVDAQAHSLATALRSFQGRLPLHSNAPDEVLRPPLPIVCESGGKQRLLDTTGILLYKRARSNQI